MADGLILYSFTDFRDKSNQGRKGLDQLGAGGGYFDNLRDNLESRFRFHRSNDLGGITAKLAISAGIDLE